MGPILASHFGDAMLGALAPAGGRDGRPMRFSIEQRFAADVDAVARAYADPALYVALVGLPKLSRPEVVGHETRGETVVLRGPLPASAGSSRPRPGR